jgi:hypothetical protein
MKRKFRRVEGRDREGMVGMVGREDEEDSGEGGVEVGDGRTRGGTRGRKRGGTRTHRGEAADSEGGRGRGRRARRRGEEGRVAGEGWVGGESRRVSLTLASNKSRCTK